MPDSTFYNLYILHTPTTRLREFTSVRMEVLCKNLIEIHTRDTVTDTAYRFSPSNTVLYTPDWIIHLQLMPAIAVL